MTVPAPRRLASDIVFEAYHAFFGASETEIFQLGVRVSVPFFPAETIIQLAHEAARTFMHLPVLIKKKSPIVIVGDLHGNLIDLLRIFNNIYNAGLSDILFLGDYVDRGQFSTEVVTMVFALLCKYPGYVTVIRGNHEFVREGGKNAFFDELKITYGDAAPDVYAAIQNAFSWMPLAVIVDDVHFCVHGGISAYVPDAELIAHVKRPLLDYQDPGIADLLWSDPSTNISGYISSSRGIGHFFGKGAVIEFLTKNGFQTLIRGHQCVLDGVQWMFDHRVVTVFSTSFYSDDENKCGYLTIDATGIHERTFKAFRGVCRSKAQFEPVVVRQAKPANAVMSLRGRLALSGRLITRSSRRPSEVKREEQQEEALRAQQREPHMRRRSGSFALIRDPYRPPSSASIRASAGPFTDFPTAPIPVPVPVPPMVSLEAEQEATADTVPLSCL